MTRVETPRFPYGLVSLLLVLPLLLIRLPSLVEPAGADQMLYAYVGQRIAAGEVPYRDAFDQKPPAVHFIYSALWKLWPEESAVAAADLVAAGLTAWLLIVLGRRTFGGGVGLASACLFLLLGTPALQRLGGVRVRAQCETFIALAVTAAMVLAARRARPGGLALAGVFLGLAFWLKYNAGVYVLPVAAVALGTWGAGRASLKPQASSLTPALWIASGFLLVSAAFLSYFAAHGALTDLRLATIDYNLQYSGETYVDGFSSVVDYLLFPLQRARVDLLWYLGGAGLIALLAARWREWNGWIAAAWVAAACVSIAVNGARNLPQYFVQAQPALALAAAAGFTPLLRATTRRAARAALLVVLAAGLWRVGDEPAPIRIGGLPEVVRNAMFDLAYLRGQLDRSTFLARFQQQADAKFVPLSADALTARVRQTTAPSDRILVFGLAPSVYVDGPRRSASRFFWSWPVMIEFARGRPGYGTAGLLDDLQRSNPALVALQKHWGTSSPEAFFMSNASLRAWLEAGYSIEEDSSEFAVWRRRS